MARNRQKSVLAQDARGSALALSAADQMGDALTIWDAIRLWRLTVSLDFISQLRYEAPAALVLAACYCTVLGRLGGVWFARGLSTKLLSNIYSRLGNRHLESLGLLRAGILSILTSAN